MKEVIFQLLLSLQTEQRNKLLRLAQQHVPQMTLDDLLQPNDFPSLEQDPYFRYEEGILAGILSCQSALYALKEELKDPSDISYGSPD